MCVYKYCIGWLDFIFGMYIKLLTKIHIVKQIKHHGKTMYNSHIGKQP